MTAPKEHPATAKKRLRDLLTVCQIATAPTLHREALLRAAEQLDLPHVTRTVRTRTTQIGSAADLKFYALPEQAALLHLPARELMHLAALTEGYLEHIEVGPGQEWHLTSAKNRARLNLPDAEVLQREDLSYRSDQAVEFDAGYSPAKCAAKLRSFAEQGYVGIYWLTSIHGRVATLAAQTQALYAKGHLPGVRWVEIGWVDFWSEADRYGGRPRCRKLRSQRIEVQARE